MSFDPYAADYDAHLTRGISLSGEAKEFFARGRLVAAAAYLAEVRVSPRRIVEFGCGTGTNLDILAAMWPESEIVGLDQSETSLHVARSRGAGRRIELMTPDEYRSRSAGPADWVFCNGVFHHIPPSDQQGVLEMIWEQLRPGGAFTVFENNPFNPGARWVMKRIPFDRDARMISPYALRHRLRTIGFDAVSVRFLFVFPRFASAFRPIESHLERLPLGAQYGAFARRPPAVRPATGSSAS